MRKYPPIDPDFYRVDFVLGMDEDEIQADWEAYCDELGEFLVDLDNKAAPSEPPPGPLSDEILHVFMKPQEAKDDSVA